MGTSQSPSCGIDAGPVQGTRLEEPAGSSLVREGEVMWCRWDPERRRCGTAWLSEGILIFVSYLRAGPSDLGFMAKAPTRLRVRLLHGGRSDLCISIGMNFKYLWLVFPRHPLARGLRPRAAVEKRQLTISA